MIPAPEEEIVSRQRYLQELLAEAGIELALIRQAADLYYYGGIIVDGFLALGPLGEPLLLVRRPQHRLQEQELPFPAAFFKDIKEIPAILGQVGLGHDGALGMELDVMPAALYRRFREQLYPQRPILDLSPLIRRLRMIKSPFEISQIKRAAHILDEVLVSAVEVIEAGVSELELAAVLEYRLRLKGHQGLVRTRGWNLEMFFGHVLSGASGNQAAYVDTPSGGTGFSHGFPQGAGTKLLAPGEPISVDLAACVNGYIADETRLYVVGDLPDPAWEALTLVEKLFTLYEQEARPGVMPGDLYHLLLEEVKAAGRQDQFMGFGQDRVLYVGHGVGLELDEFPIIAAKFPYPLAAEMVIAFEPKFFLPGIGMIGFEDTGRITPDGVEWLTRSPRQVWQL
ncbi:MAG: aminopeptidase P family protein [Deltaproteobacteria bacterium]|nr:aminopeptidase P family protein [Deltaproteobacteria bacterium]